MHSIVSAKRKVIRFQENEKKKTKTVDHFREKQESHSIDFQNKATLYKPMENNL